jgi:hypothetical protein
MGTNMYPSSALLGQNKDESIAALPVDDLIEKADGFAGVFPGMFFKEEHILLGGDALIFNSGLIEYLFFFQNTSMRS